MKPEKQTNKQLNSLGLTCSNDRDLSVAPCKLTPISFTFLFNSF